MAVNEVKIISTTITDTTLTDEENDHSNVVAVSTLIEGDVDAGGRGQHNTRAVTLSVADVEAIYEIILAAAMREVVAGLGSVVVGDPVPVEDAEV